MKKIKICCMMCMLMLGIGGCSWKQNQDMAEHSESFFAMDTYMTFTAYGTDAEPAILAAEDKIREMEELWSVTDKNSDVYAVNHSSGQTVTVDWKTAELLEKVGYDKVELNNDQIQMEPGGMIDLGAVGKGYAGDEAAQILRERGITAALLDIGGNIQAIGTKPDGSDWRVGLKDPFSGGVLGIIQVSDVAVVTSGNYERFFIGEDGKVYGHIIDPATGHPVENGIASVSVIASEGKLCDALSTALFVMGLENAQDYWRQHRNYEMILIMEDGDIYLTEGIRDSFSLNSEYRNMKINVID
jgi:thiamine biosynthesis lipoprotein